MRPSFSSSMAHLAQLQHLGVQVAQALRELIQHGLRPQLSNSAQAHGVLGRETCSAWAQQGS